MSSSMTKTTGMGGGGFLGKSGDEWADIGLTVGGVALATAGVIGIGGLILDNFGGGGGSSSPSSEVRKETVYLMYPDGRVLPANGPAVSQPAAPASPQPAAPVAPQPAPAPGTIQQVAAPASPQPAAPVAPQPAPNPAPQPTFVTEAVLEKKIEDVKTSVIEAMKNMQEAATIRIDDSALEKIAEMVAAKQAESQPAPAPEAK